MKRLALALLALLFAAPSYATTMADLVLGKTALASLSTPPTNFAVIDYCSDCTAGTSPCTGSGTGAIYIKLAGQDSFCIDPNGGGGGGKFFSGGTTDQVSTTEGSYFPIQGVATHVTYSGTVFNGIDRSLGAPTGTFSNLRCDVGATPGSGNTWHFYLANSGGNTALDCTITNAASSCSDAVSTVSSTVGNFWVFAVEIDAGTPTATDARCFVSFS